VRHLARCLILFLLAGLLPWATPLLAAHTRLHQAEKDLIDASADGINSADQQKLVETASTLLKAVFSSNQDQDHLAAAVRDTGTALSDLDNNENSDTIKKDISQALEEIRAELTILEGDSSTATTKSSSKVNAFGSPVPPPSSGFLRATTYANTIWVSTGNDFGARSIIKFGSDGKFTELWKTESYSGSWQANQMNTEVVVKRDDNQVLRYRLHPDLSLVRELGSVVYQTSTSLKMPTVTASAPATNSSAPSSPSSGDTNASGSLGLDVPDASTTPN